MEKIVTSKNTKIKNCIAVMSGKGGVGKSSVTSVLATNLNRQGYKVGIMDADITGPSIPKVFGVNKKRAGGNSEVIFPVESVTGIKMISINLLIPNEEEPVIWRGPAISGVVKQFYSEVEWGELDYLLIDMPPGTGDVPLTIMQSIAIDGVVVVSSPQDLVKLIVKKSINMTKKMNVDVLGIVENMSYLKCPDCDKKINIFGESKLDDVAEEYGVNVIHKMPIDPEFAKLCDEGKIELYHDYNKDFTDQLTANVNTYLTNIK